MALDKVIMRDTTAEINTGTIGVPVWVEIGGINSISHSPGSNKADGTTYASAGAPEHKVLSRTHNFSLEGLMIEDVGDGSRDAGQEAVETAAQAVGVDSIKQYRLTTPGGTTLTFEASAEVTEFGGGNDDFATWSCELEVTGTITRA